jgi:hypothetical protein
LVLAEAITEGVITGVDCSMAVESGTHASGVMFQHPKEDLQLLRSEPVPIDI